MMVGTNPPRGAIRAGRLSKQEGSFYTPATVADAIVALSGLGQTTSTDSHVIDPAAGDGALLVAAIPVLVGRMRDLGLANDGIRDLLVANMHAIELDPNEAERCRQRLSAVAAEVLGGAGIAPGEWDVVTGDACSEWERYEGRMGFVLMNPPYVRIHNLASRPSSPYMTGMCDLYYAFFDYAQRMLSDGGVLSAIAPSSWMTSKAGNAMREDLRDRGAIRAICDYGHMQVFSPYATTYTALILIGTGASDTISVWDHDDNGRLLASTDVRSLSCWHHGLFMPDAPSEMDDIMAVPLGGDISVRNGYATNLDGFFMSGTKRFPAHEISVIKASTATPMFAVYPYDEHGQLVPFDEIERNAPALASAFVADRDRLLARTQVDESRWWAYGRTQGIVDTHVDKVTVQSLVMPGVPPRTAEAPAGTGVFGGIYVTGMGRDELDEAVSSEEFFAYVKALHRHKSGGYYAFGGRDLERFLIWWRKAGSERTPNSDMAI